MRGFGFCLLGRFRKLGIFKVKEMSLELGSFKIDKIVVFLKCLVLCLICLSVFKMLVFINLYLFVFIEGKKFREIFFLRFDF